MKSIDYYEKISLLCTVKYLKVGIVGSNWNV